MRILRIIASAAMFVGCAAGSVNAQYYLDTDGGTAGFQAANGGVYSLSGSFWNPNASGSGALGSFPDTDPGPIMTIGTAASDFAGLAFTIHFDTDYRLGGIDIGSGSAVVTLTGNGNNAPAQLGVWHVAAGSTLNQNNDYVGNPGMNWQGNAVTFTGGGTFNFNKMLGFNSGGLISQNGVGSVVNLNVGSTPDGGAPFTGGYTLMNGTLNFGSAISFDAFKDFSSNPFTIEGGNLGNTSGAPLTLNVGAAGYQIGGDFSFTGTSDLNLGTAPVVLTGNRQITVASNNLTVGGVMSGGFGLAKAGPGVLTLTAANTYSGPTTVSSGVLALSGSGSIADSASVEINAGAALDVSGLPNFTMLASQPFIIHIDGSGSGSSGQINASGSILDITNGNVTLNVLGVLDDPVYLLGSYSTLLGGQFSVVNPVLGYSLDYNYQGSGQIALVAPVAAAVPEPSTISMGLLVVIGLLLGRPFYGARKKI